MTPPRVNLRLVHDVRASKSKPLVPLKTGLNGPPSAFLPCPFCGGRIDPSKDVTDHAHDGVRGRRVVCPTCDAIGPFPKQNAVKAWNRRK